MTASRWCYERELPSDPGILGSLYTTLRQWAVAAGLGTTGCYRITVAVSEAVTNAIIHAHAGATEKTVRLALGVQGNQLVAEVGDRGTWGWKAPDPPDEAHWEQTSGRGIHLIRKLSRSAAFMPRPGGGTLVRMIFAGKKVESMEGDIIVDKKQVGQGGGQMETRTELIDDVDVLRITGRIDLVTSNTLKDTVREHLHRQRRNLVLNLEQVDFINSSGLGSLVSILKDVRLAGGSLVLSNLAPYVQEIFDITQLSNVFDSFATEKDAIGALTGHAASVTANP